MLHFLAKMILIGIAHFAMGVFFYYQRTTHRSPVFDSDVVVFLVPTVLAFGGYFMVTWLCEFLTHHFAARVATVVLIALAATAVSSICAMTFAFNKFGT